MKIILASASPRRAQLLSQLELSFQQRPVDIDESVLKDEDPKDYVMRLALQKAQAAQALSSELLIGSDTTVVAAGEILQKPLDKTDFERMWRLLSGQTHDVYTALALVKADQSLVRLQHSQVRFCPLTQADMDWYWQTGEAKDKAGGYGVQGKAARFIEHISGSYSGIMGLPLYELAEMLKEMALPIGRNSER